MDYEAAQAKLKKIKELIFQQSMELEDVAEDLGSPLKSEVLEVSALIQEQCDVLEEILEKDTEERARIDGEE